MEEVYGDVVARLPVGDVEMKVDRNGVRVSFIVPKTDTIGVMSLDTDIDTGRRMVEGEVSVLVVVSDGGDDE